MGGMKRAIKNFHMLFTIEAMKVLNQNTDKVSKGPAEANVLMYTSAYGDKQVNFAKFQLSKMYRF